MAEQENGSSPLAEALARVGDRWTRLMVEALLAGPLRLLSHWAARRADPAEAPRNPPPGPAPPRACQVRAGAIDGSHGLL